MTNVNQDIHAASNALIARAMAKDPSLATTAKSSNPAGVLKRSNAYFIDPARITRREGWNPRFDFGEIETLAAQIKGVKAGDEASGGLLNPIRVKRIVGNPDADFELIDGDRRLSAIEFLMKKGETFPVGIPAVIVDKSQDDITSLTQMFLANEGKKFLPMEEAIAYQRMRDAGMTLKQICAAVGRKQVHVTEILNLLDADDTVKEAATKGEIGKTMAKQIATAAKGDKTKQKELVEAAKAAGTDKTAQRAVKRKVDTARVAKAAKKGKVLKIRALSDAELSDIGAAVAEHLSKKLEDMGISVEEDLVEMIKKDPNMILAYTTGALDALKVAAGGPNNLFI